MKVYVVVARCKDFAWDTDIRSVVGVYKNNPNLELVGRKWIDEHSDADVYIQRPGFITGVSFDGFIDDDVVEVITFTVESFEVQ